MSRFLRFLRYDNAVPIAFSIILMGAGATYAATNPETILASEQAVVSVDNTYLLNVDLSTRDARMLVTDVTEDDENYYVTYSYSTIAVEDYAWKERESTDTMTVSKKELLGKDLGVFVSKQLSEIVRSDMTYLLAVQDQQRASGESRKVVSTAYSGLIGRFLSPSEEVFEGYVPVVDEPLASETEGGSGPTHDAAADQGRTVASGSRLISLQVAGKNPSRIPLHSSYVDLGVIFIDPRNTNVGVHIFLDGVETVSPSIDTSTSTVYTIEYKATDPNGVTVMARRIVLIGDAVDPGTKIDSSGSVSAVAPAPAAPDEIPVPEPILPETPPVSEPEVVTPPAEETEALAPDAGEPDPASPIEEVATSTTP